jgi:hypothetical protein
LVPAAAGDVVNDVTDAVTNDFANDDKKNVHICKICDKAFSKATALKVS